MKILRIPVDQYNNIDKLLQLEHYGDVLGLMDYRGRTQAAAYVLQRMVDNVSSFAYSQKMLLLDEMRFLNSISDQKFMFSKVFLEHA